MAKALKIVGTVVAVVAVAASAVATFGASIGLGVGALSAAAGVATVAGVAAAVIGVASAVLFKPGFTNQGNPQQFQTNPQSGLPYATGRTRMSGVRFFAETSRTPGYTKADDLLWFGVMLSAGGQIGGIEKFTADNELIAFNAAGASPGKYFTWMEQVVWAGGMMASALAISMNGGSPPNWTSAHKLSGITHALWGLRYDAKNGEYYSAGVPQPAWIGRWVRVYDPRKDSTYPGGAGSHRALNEATYEWSRNPALHALTWALGRWQNGKRTLGIGAPFANIRVGDFVEAANVADANNWGCGGVEYSTDSKWDVLKRMLQAGGAIPTMTGAMIGCRVNKPRLSVATITSADLLDEFSGAVTKPRRDRYNTVIPRYRSESHEWEVISAKPVSVPAFVTQDNGIRQKEIDYPLVQAEVGQGSFDGDSQAGQLAAYDIANSREAGPIKWTTGPKFIGLKTGDCVTLDVPDEGYAGQPVIITSVSLDPSSGKISFTAETETDSKHAFALGTSAVPPPPFALTPPDLTPPTPDMSDWTLVPGSTRDGLPIIRLVGGLETPAWDHVIVQYRLSPSGDWTSAGTYAENGDTLIEIGGADGEASYVVRLAYQKGAITGEWLEMPVTTTLAAGFGPLSGNLLQDSTFYNGSTEGWVFSNSGGMVAVGGVNTGGAASLVQGENVLAIRQDNAGTAGFADWYCTINAEPGKWYEASVRAGVIRCGGQLILSFLDNTGAIIGGAPVNLSPVAGGNYLSDYAINVVKGKAPAGTARARLYLRKMPTNSGPNSFANFLRPQIVETTENAASPVPYSPSGVGQKGADGIDALSASASPPAVVVPCTYNGTPKAAIPGFSINAFQGPSNVTAAAGYSVTSTGLSAVSHTGGGVFTVGGMAADEGTVEVTVTHDGASCVVTVPYTKARDGAPFVAGASAVVTPTTTTYASMAVVTLLMGPNGTIKADVGGSFDGPGSLINVAGYFEYSLNGGSSWATIGSALTTSPAVAGDTGTFDGTVTADGSAIALTTRQNVMIRLMMRLTNTNQITGWSARPLAVSWSGT